MIGRYDASHFTQQEMKAQRGYFTVPCLPDKTKS